MASSDAARQRAQAAYGIASAIAAGVIAAGLFGGIDHRPPIVRVFAGLALVSWLVAAGVFLHTVGSPFRSGTPPSAGVDAFVHGVLEAIRDERTTIDAWQRRGQMLSGVAAVLTVAGFLAAVSVGGTRHDQAAEIWLTNQGRGVIRELCGSSATVVSAAVDEQTLGDPMIQVTLPARTCLERARTLVVTRDDVAAMVLR